MTYTFTNIKKLYQGVGLVWDATNFYKIGNYVYPTYDPCESSNVPLRGIVRVEVDGEVRDVQFMAATDGQWVTMVVEMGIYWHCFNRLDLKSCIEAASDYSNYGTPIDTTVCYRYEGSGLESSLKKVRMYQVPRIFTWEDIDAFVLEVLETIDIEGALFSLNFIRLADGKILCRQNNQMYHEAVVEQGDGEIIATMPKWIFRHNPIFCLFMETENGIYEREQIGDIVFDLQAARNWIAERIKFKRKRA